jgi:hypothetical protein
VPALGGSVIFALGSWKFNASATLLHYSDAGTQDNRTLIARQSIKQRTLCILNIRASIWFRHSLHIIILQFLRKIAMYK